MENVKKSKFYRIAAGTSFGILYLILILKMLYMVNIEYSISDAIVMIIYDVLGALPAIGMAFGLFNKKEFIINASMVVFILFELISYIDNIIYSFYYYNNFYYLGITYMIIDLLPIVAYCFTFMISVNKKRFKVICLIPALLLLIYALFYLSSIFFFNLLNFLPVIAILFTCLWMVSKPLNEKEGEFENFVYKHYKCAKVTIGVIFAIVGIKCTILGIYFSGVQRKTAFPFLIIFLIILFFLAWGMINKIFKKCAKDDEKLQRQKKLKEKEDREVFLNEIKSVMQHSSDKSYSLRDFSSAAETFGSLYNRIVVSYLDRPLPVFKKHKSSALRGGAVAGLFGTYAGIYTAIKVENENLKNEELYKENLSYRRKNIEKCSNYYTELSAQFEIIVRITKKYMDKKVDFLKQLPSDYDKMYDLCCSNSNSPDKNVQICANGLISYLNALKLCKITTNNIY